MRSNTATRLKIKKLFCTDCFFQAALDSAQFAVLAIDREGYLIYLNDLARDLIDFRIDIRVKKIHYADLDYTTWIKFKEIIETGEPQIGVPVMAFSRPLVANRSPILIEGETVGVMSVFHELTKYENISDYMQKYRNLTKQVEALIDSSYDGIFVTDGEGIGIRSNAAYDRITEVDSSAFIGRNMRDLEKEGVLSKSVTLKVLKSKKRETISQVLSSGKEVLVTGNPIFNDQGEIIMVMTNLRDMTDLNSINRELVQSKQMTSVYKEQLQELQRSFVKSNDLVAVSESMQDVYEVATRVSATDATVFIHGETGVGKDRIAEEIHQVSERSKTGIFVKINCGAIPENLLESELFGYVKGAFTGASKEGKPGLFEIAHKGTLFLDEIDSMPVVLQSKLLRVLQNFEIRRVGSTLTKTVDVRLICASNQDMKELLLKKRFRSDLYYRLNVIPIFIPPLRERTADIPELITLFLKIFNQKHSMQKTLSRECSDLLLRYSWPGNVRELANVIERLVVLTNRDCIMGSDLPGDIREVSRTEHNEIKELPLKEQLKRVETEIISSAMKKYGNARQAALHLRVNPSTICRKLQNSGE
jgi:PAS domain S-box-containing protein